MQMNNNLKGLGEIFQVLSASLRKINIKWSPFVFSTRTECMLFPSCSKTILCMGKRNYK